MTEKEYPKFVEKTSPKTSKLKTMIWAFVVGGLICCIGEAAKDLLNHFFTLSDTQSSSYTTIVMIFIGSFFTALGLYDKLGRKAGAGSIVPITGFANSVASSAIEHNREGVIFGICAHIFTIAGPIIVFRMVLAFVSGLMELIFGLPLIK